MSYPLPVSTFVGPAKTLKPVIVPPVTTPAPSTMKSPVKTTFDP